jgi:TPP-dependent pyruvate/acetoin dehydrogenase alpha subunit
MRQAIAAQEPERSGAPISSVLRLYEEMRLIATVEQALLDLFSRGLISGTIHTSLGQESCAVAVAGQLKNGEDYVFSTHRCHGHYIAFTGDLEGLVGEILGKASGVCKGIGGSQHLSNGTFFSNGILGGIAAVATGAAFGLKNNGPGRIAAVFLGDGAFGEGIVYEAMNIAALWKLPVLFAVEDNGYAQSTPKHLEHSGQLVDRGRPFGIPIVACDARDPETLVRQAGSLIQEMRQSGGPAMFYMHTYRLAPHSKGDDDRDHREIAAEAEYQPLARLGRRIPEAERIAIDRAVGGRVDQVVKAALAMPASRRLP